ncbi:MAG: hypothetical protein ABSG50_01565 [Opitutaceae bacterium]|jgi:hypothetical protein
MDLAKKFEKVIPITLAPLYEDRDEPFARIIDFPNPASLPQRPLPTGGCGCAIDFPEPSTAALRRQWWLADEVEAKAMALDLIRQMESTALGCRCEHCMLPAAARSPRRSHEPLGTPWSQQKTPEKLNPHED